MCIDKMQVKKNQMKITQLQEQENTMLINETAASMEKAYFSVILVLF
jgi:hypothetical protein